MSVLQENIITEGNMSLSTYMGYDDEQDFRGDWNKLHEVITQIESEGFSTSSYTMLFKRPSYVFKIMTPKNSLLIEEIQTDSKLACWQALVKFVRQQKERILENYQ